MKLIDLIKISFHSAYRTKSSFIIMILIFISSISCLFSLSYKNSFENYFDVYIQKSPEFRIMNVSYQEQLDNSILTNTTLTYEEKLEYVEEIQEKVISKLNENKHILGASTEYRNNIDTNDFGINYYSFTLQAVPITNNINIVSGNNISSNTNEIEIICPNIMRYENSDNTFNINNTIDMKNYLNKTIKGKYSSKSDTKLKIVGLYDTYSTYSYGGVCYTSYDNLELLQNNYYLEYPDILQNLIDYKIETNDYASNIYIMIDDISNLNQVKKFLKKNNFFTEESIVSINTDTIEEVNNICSKITVSLYILTSIIICITLIQNIINKSKKIFIYHAVGYKDSDIFKLIFLENSILISIGFIFSIIFTQIGLNIYKNQILINKSRLYLMNPKVDIISILISFILALLIPFIATIIIYTLSKNNKIHLEEE